MQSQAVLYFFQTGLFLKFICVFVCFVIGQRVPLFCTLHLINFIWTGM